MSVKCASFDSSVGRAVDCRGVKLSIGRWFKSGSKDFFFFSFSSLTIYSQFFSPTLYIYIYLSIFSQSISEAHEASAQEGDTAVSVQYLLFA